MNRNHAATAEGLIDLFGFDGFEGPDGDQRYARALAAGIRISEALHDLHLIRTALTK